MVRHNPPKPPPLVEPQAQPSSGCAFFLVFSNRVCALCPPRASPFWSWCNARKSLLLGAQACRPTLADRGGRLIAARAARTAPRFAIGEGVGAPHRTTGGAVILLSPVRFLFPRASTRAASWQTRCPSVRARVRIIDCGQGRCVVGCEILSSLRAGNCNGPLRDDSGQR